MNFKFSLFWIIAVCIGLALSLPIPDTNAQRLARGLPPLPPRRRSTVPGARPSPSPSPKPPSPPPAVKPTPTPPTPSIKVPTPSIKPPTSSSSSSYYKPSSSSSAKP